MKVVIDDTKRIIKVLNNNYSGDPVKRIIDIPDKTWVPKIIGYHRKSITVKDPDWTRPILQDSDGNTVYNTILVEVPDPDWVPQPTGVSKDGSKKNIISNLIDKLSNMDPNMVYEDESKRPYITVPKPDINDPMLDMSIEHPTVIKLVEDKSKPIYEDESKRPTIPVSTTVLVIPDNVIEVSKVPKYFTDIVSMYYRVIGGLVVLDPPVGDVLKTQDALLRKYVLNNSSDVLDTVASKIKNIALGGPLSPDQKNRYADKYAIAKEYKSSKVTNSLTDILQAEADDKGISLDFLVDTIINLGGSWEPLRLYINLYIDRMRIKINSIAMVNPLQAYHVLLELRCYDIYLLGEDSSNPINDVLDNISKVINKD